MTPRLLVLIPLSRSKAVGGRASSHVGLFDGVLDDPRRRVRSALAELLRCADPSELVRVLGARGPLLERAVETTTALAGDPPLLAAW